jgi:hypothetical protein
MKNTQVEAVSITGDETHEIWSEGLCSGTSKDYGIVGDKR